MIRSLVERVTRKIVLRRRLSAEFGRRPFLATPDATLSLLKPGMASFHDLAAACKQLVRLGHNVWDVGGNMGIFSLMASHFVGVEGTVLCVEPDPYLASLIQKTMLLSDNADRTSNVFCAAMSGEVGISEFLIASRGRASNSLAVSGGRSQSGGVRYRQYVPTFTLDRLLDSFPPPDVLKIDVEGAEHLVLQGAKKLLAEVRPSLYIEVGELQQEDVTRVLLEAGYKLFDPETPTIPIETCTYNTIAVPNERATVGLAA